MAYLGKVARADAIAVILQMKGEGYTTYIAHNLPIETSGAKGCLRRCSSRAMTGARRTKRRRAWGTHYSDGRNADTLAVVPVVWKDQSSAVSRRCSSVVHFRRGPLRTQQGR